jgi:chromosome segregation ATPase
MILLVAIPKGLERRHGAARSERFGQQGRKRLELCSIVGTGLRRDSSQSRVSSGRSLRQHGRACPRDRSPRPVAVQERRRTTKAEKRTETAERECREIIIEIDFKLQDASKALKQAQSRLAANEDRLTEVEFRAQAAEAEAREAKHALALVEEAIRTRLLCASPEALAG